MNFSFADLPFIIFKVFVHPDGSPPVINGTDWMSVDSTMQIRVKPKPSGHNAPGLSGRITSTLYIWGRLLKKKYAERRDHFGLKKTAGAAD